MTPKALAKTLRRRQLRLRLAASFAVESRSDEEILSAYLTCSKCGGELFANRRAAIRNAGSVAEFLNMVNMALAIHLCFNKN